MNKEYVNPKMAVENIELESLIAASIMGDAEACSNALGKDREEIWEEDTDLWGDDCWTRVN